MRKKLALVFISSLILSLSAKADMGFSEPSDYTGDSFFQTATPISKPKENNGYEREGTTPPIKQLRLFLKSKIKQSESKR